MSLLRKKYNVYNAARLALLAQQAQEREQLTQLHGNIEDIIGNRALEHLKAVAPNEWADTKLCDVDIYYYDDIEVDGPSHYAFISWGNLGDTK